MNSIDEPKKLSPAMSKRWTYGLLALTLVMVLMPYWFWHATWFGRPLSDAQIGKYLVDSDHPRHIQQALSQIADREIRGDKSAAQWYPQIVALASSSVPEIRVTVAWVMGQDNTVADFHAALLKMLGDSNPMVQRNAALALVRFSDSAGHAQVVGILEPYALAAPFAGALEERLKPGDTLNPGTLLARIEQAGEKREVRSEVPGTLDAWLESDGATVQAGRPIARIAPSVDEVLNALAALRLIGTRQDLAAIERFASPATGMPPQVAQLARSTADAIRQRPDPSASGGPSH